MKLDVAYLLEDTALFGGVKVVLHQANLLARRGHRVVVVSKGPRPEWYDLECDFLQVPELSPESLPAADVTVATFWTTLGPALASGRGEVAHLCQGFEGSLLHNREEHPAILQAYRHPVPVLAVGPHLAWLLRSRFQRPSRVILQGLEGFWFTVEGPREGPRPIPRILVTAPFEFYVKGVDVALEAVRRLREMGLDCRLVRLSQLPASSQENGLLVADEFHRSLLPPQVAPLMRGCDLLLAPSWPQEGFGLPVLEAMACGLPSVVSDIPAFRCFAASAASLVRFDSPRDFALAALETLRSPARWRAMAGAGLRVAEEHSETAAAETLEKALVWVAEGSWREELRSSATSNGRGEEESSAPTWFR